MITEVMKIRSKQACRLNVKVDRIVSDAQAKRGSPWVRGNLKLNSKFVETTASLLKYLIALIFQISLCVRNNSRNYSVCPHMLGVQLVTVITTNVITITMLKGLALRSWSFTSDLNARNWQKCGGGRRPKVEATTSILCRVGRALTFPPTIFLRENKPHVIPKQINLPCFRMTVSEHFLSNTLKKRKRNRLKVRK